MSEVSDHDRSDDAPGGKVTGGEIREGGRPIVAGIDGSTESERGVRWASRLAVALDSPLVLVHALGLISRSMDWHVTTGERIKTIETELLPRWTSFLDEDEGAVEWSARIEHGTPSRVLLVVADEVDAAMIVVGSHGAGTSEDPFLGSTSHRVVADSHRPVVVVPPSTNHPHQRSGAGAMASGIADATP
ncbi:MAG: universal stress protein [Actinomycetota bacterium]